MRATAILSATRRHVLAAAAVLTVTATSALAQTFPSQIVRLVVPAPPGGTLDVLARIIGEELQPALGQTVIVENKPGGAGMIGVGELLKSPRDGHTVLIHISGIVAEIPHIAKPPYDPFTAIKPLVDVARSGLIFVAAPALQAKTLPEAIAYVKANPGKTNYASYTAGTISHTLGIEMNKVAGLDMTHVAHKGSPPALQDLMGNHVQFMFDGPATSLALVKSNSIKGIAVTTPTRMSALPNVPTFAELGFPNLTQVAWVGLWLTPDVPAAAQDRLRAEVTKALAKPSVRERFANLGMEPGSGKSTTDLSAELKASFDKQGTILKSVNFTPGQ